MAKRDLTHDSPFMYFVAEYMQISAPNARGRCGGSEKNAGGIIPSAISKKTY